MSHDPPRGDADHAAADRTAARDPAETLRRLLATFEDGEARPAAEALLRVAAPRLAGKLGGAAHLTHLFTNPAWAPLLGHRAARLGALERIHDAARARIEVEAADGTRVVFLASLRRAPDDAADPAWRLTGLVREELADL